MIIRMNRTLCKTCALAIGSGYVVSLIASYQAASMGHVECLKYLHENGLQWDHWVCQYAAEK